MPIVLKSGSLNPLEPSGHLQACNGIALPFTPLLYWSDCHSLAAFTATGSAPVHLTQNVRLAPTQGPVDANYEVKLRIAEKQIPAVSMYGASGTASAAIFYRLLSFLS